MHSTTHWFQWPDNRRAALSLSFDDARLTQVDRGIPLLNHLGVRASFYLSQSGLADRLDGWRAALAAGHEIGNHSVHHPCSGNFCWSRQHALEDYTLAQMEEELREANAVVQRRLNVTPATFAYPCGQTFVGRGTHTASYVPVVARLFVAGRGFGDEIHNDPGFCDLAQVGAMDSDGKTFEELRALLDTAVAAGGWLVLAGHEMGQDGAQTTRLDVLDKLCRYAADPARGVWVGTVLAVARYVKACRRRHQDGD